MRDYFRELVDRFGTVWNRFWYRPMDVGPICLLRLLTGCVALYYVLSFSSDLTRWFGPDGLLNVDTARRLSGADRLPYTFHWSYLYWATTPSILWIFHVAGALVVLSFAVGFLARLSAVGTLVVVLSYVHRGPMITGQLEPVLTMVLLYLCLAPCGRRYSVDARLRHARRTGSEPSTSESPPRQQSILANVALRLVQLHLTGFYIMTGLNMLAGDTWWTGEGVWWLLARPESRLLDLTFLAHSPLLVNAWTHAITAFLFLFPVLIWVRIARPLLLALSLLFWMGMAVITGYVGWAVMMVVAGLAFLPSSTLES